MGDDRQFHNQWSFNTPGVHQLCEKKKKKTCTRCRSPCLAPTSRCWTFSRWWIYSVRDRSGSCDVPPEWTEAEVVLEYDLKRQEKKQSRINAASQQKYFYISHKLLKMEPKRSPHLLCSLKGDLLGGMRADEASLFCVESEFDLGCCCCLKTSTFGPAGGTTVKILSIHQQLIKINCKCGADLEHDRWQSQKMITFWSLDAISLSGTSFWKKTTKQCFGLI